MNQPEYQNLGISQLDPRLYTHAVPEAALGEAMISGRKRRKDNRGDRNSGGAKRKLSDEQVKFLESSFDRDHKLDSERKCTIALELGLDPKQVAVWFQNRRARWKTQKLEEEYSNLKIAYKCVVDEKCRLETEAFKLREQLLEAESNKQKVCMHSKRVLTSSPGSSSTGMNQPEVPDAFMVEELNNLCYVLDYSYIRDLVLYGL